ncbi:MAG: glycoside hydrolase family 30 protein [Prevotella sp.]|jgi:glucosylceramidase
MKKNNMYITSLLFSACLCLSSACTVDSGLDIQPEVQPDNTVPSPTPQPGEVRTFTTTANGFIQLQQNSTSLKAGESLAPSTILIDDTKEGQQVDGFGFAITYSTCYNLLHMSAADRADFLKRTYSETEGYGVSYARISIGCNDFSSTEYTLCDEKGLENFRLYKDETDYVIPVLKEILAINPHVKIVAAPWTCPKWMKVKDLASKAPFDSWTDGHLNPDYYTDYANYFVKFVQAMKAEGIDIYAVSPQNEPLNKANCASTYMPWQEQAEFVKELAKAFKKNALKTKIYLFDHNYNYDNIADQEDYPVKIYNALGNDFEGSEYIVGAAYHDYGGNNSELDDIYAQAPDKELIFSESSIGTWNDGRNLSARLLADMKNIILGTLNRHCKAVLVWNLMLDEKMGPNLDGGCQTCYGAVDIASDYKTLRRNSHYYIITHISSVVRPGAVKIEASAHSANIKDIDYVAFRNPDSSYGIIFANSGGFDQLVTVSNGAYNFQVKVPAEGVISCAWNPSITSQKD